MALFYLPETMKTASESNVNEPQNLDIERRNESQNLDIESNTEPETETNAIHGEISNNEESSLLLPRPKKSIDERIRICYNSIVAYCLLAFSSTLFVELYPLWTATDPGPRNRSFNCNYRTHLDDLPTHSVPAPRISLLGRRSFPKQPRYLHALAPRTSAPKQTSP